MRLVKGLVVLVLLAGTVVAGGLVWMHLDIEKYRAPLPLVSDLLELEKMNDLPVAVSVVETARQVLPRASVLDPSLDPHPGEPYVMTHPAFVLEWADGRLLLVDVGMTKQGALEFGAPIERFFHGQPIEPLTPVATALGDAAARVQGVVFTHLHADHVGGLGEVCARIGHPTKVFQTEAQQDSWTVFTAPGKRELGESGCAQPVRLAAKPLMLLEGFPGVGVVGVGGHTPGSQAIFAAVRPPGGEVRRFVFSGDVTNTIDGIRDDIPKPLFYRVVVIPEDDDRLGEVRRYLRSLEKSFGFAVAVAHDQRHLATLGIPAWGS